MESELLNAAKEGSVETLLKLIQQDKFILRRYIPKCFKETPLHIAAMYGHLEFTKAILARVPEMAKELDAQKSTPLHIATAYGHILIVKELLLVNPDMCLAKDCEGRDPAHIAVIKDKIDILEELVRFSPGLVQASVGASTILHLCVRHYQLKALKFILRKIPNDAEFVNFKDEEGFTILHLAVVEKQTEVVKFLLHEHRKIDVNATNVYGFTAWDICLSQGRKNIKDIEVAECFRQAGESEAISATRSMFRPEDVICNDSSANIVPNSEGNHTKLMTIVKNFCFSRLQESESEKKKRLEDSSNAFMIVASLIAAVTFQALVQPPDKIGETDNSSWSLLFLYLNTLSFSTAVFVILLLISGFPIECRPCIWILRIAMWIAVLSVALAYIFVVEIVAKIIPYATEDERSANEAYVLVVVVLLIAIFMLGHAIRILFKIGRYFYVRVNKDGQGGSNSNAQGQSCV